MTRIDARLFMVLIYSTLVDHNKYFCRNINMFSSEVLAQILPGGCPKMQVYASLKWKIIHVYIYMHMYTKGLGKRIWTGIFFRSIHIDLQSSSALILTALQLDNITLYAMAQFTQSVSGWWTFEVLPIFQFQTGLWYDSGTWILMQ